MDGWRFFKTADGNEIVKSELGHLPRKAKAALIALMKGYKKGTLLRDQLQHLGNGISYLKATVDGCEYRLYFGRVGKGGCIPLAVRAMEKKRQSVPPNEVKLMRARLNEWISRGRTLRGDRG